MEPTASSTEAVPKKGRLGSRENPEVLENVPGHIIPILEKEFDDFDERSEFFLGGGESEEQFIGFRLKQGVYGQRQPDRQMMRIKLPLGGVTPDQMDAFASVIADGVSSLARARPVSPRVATTPLKPRSRAIARSVFAKPGSSSTTRSTRSLGMMR